MLGSCRNAKTGYKEEPLRNEIRIQGSTFGKIPLPGKLAFLFTMLAQVTESEVLTAQNIRKSRLIDGNEEGCKSTIDYHKVFNNELTSNFLETELANIKDEGLRKELQGISNKLEALKEKVTSIQNIQFPKTKKRMSFDKVKFANDRQFLIEYHQLLNKYLRLPVKAQKKTPRNVAIMK